MIILLMITTDSQERLHAVPCMMNLQLLHKDYLYLQHKNTLYIGNAIHHAPMTVGDKIGSVVASWKNNASELELCLLE